jgi:hypothetical protein
MSSGFSFSTKAAARKITGFGFGPIAVLFADGTVEEVSDGTPAAGASTMPLMIPGGGPAVGATDIGGSVMGWCAAMTDGRVACTFPDEPGATAMDVVGVGVGFGSSCVLTRSGNVGCSLLADWSHAVGADTDGYMSVGMGEPATGIAEAETFACALLASGGIKCWGPSDNCVAAFSPPCDYGSYILAGSVVSNAEGTFTWNDIDLGTFNPPIQE